MLNYFAILIINHIFAKQLIDLFILIYTPMD